VGSAAPVRIDALEWLAVMSSHVPDKEEWLGSLALNNQESENNHPLALFDLVTSYLRE
jgi:hypothetical protein